MYSLVRERSSKKRRGVVEKEKGRVAKQHIQASRERVQHKIATRRREIRSAQGLWRNVL
jgi:hypothetical protein